MEDESKGTFEHGNPIIIKLNGMIHVDDRLALLDIARQLKLYLSNSSDIDEYTLGSQKEPVSMIGLFYRFVFTSLTRRVTLTHSIGFCPFLKMAS
jgi:hypothetical protein